MAALLRTFAGRNHQCEDNHRLQSQSSQPGNGRMAQVVECLPRKFKALSSNPNTGKKKKRLAG
jgi:hypothetical protein